MNLLDRLMRHGAKWSVPNLGELALRAHRKRAMDETLAWIGQEVDGLATGLHHGHGPARAALESAGERALADMRRRVHSEAARSGVAQAFARLDAWWAGTQEGEHIDDPGLDPWLRQRAMSHLDQTNEVTGAYDVFLDLLGPALADAHDRPLRMLDLAAGHGGFALAVARHARERGLALEITATDLKREYLDIGQASARREGLDVEFAVQDALDLSNLARHDFDVVVCTHSLHHFSPGAVALMIHEAARVARHSVLFVDGRRMLMLAMALYGYTRARMRDPILAHDAWISCRRFYAPEELLMLARLGPWGERAVVERHAAYMIALRVPGQGR